MFRENEANKANMDQQQGSHESTGFLTTSQRIVITVTKYELKRM